jgi:type II secretory pathway component PulK
MMRTQNGSGVAPKNVSCCHRHSRCTRWSPSSNRRGAVTVVALLVLLVLSGMIGQYVRRVVMERRQFRQETLHQQAEKLADAGLLVAISARQKDPAWAGFQWELPAGEIHQTNSGEVVIRMQGEICTVVARYPTNSSLPFQVTRTRKLTP